MKTVEVSEVELNPSLSVVRGSVPADVQSREGDSALCSCPQCCEVAVNAVAVGEVQLNPFRSAVREQVSGLDVPAFSNGFYFTVSFSSK